MAKVQVRPRVPHPTSTYFPSRGTCPRYPAPRESQIRFLWVGQACPNSLSPPPPLETYRSRSLLLRSCALPHGNSGQSLTSWSDTQPFSFQIRDLPSKSSQGQGEVWALQVAYKLSHLEHGRAWTLSKTAVTVEKNPQVSSSVETNYR